MSKKQSSITLLKNSWLSWHHRQPRRQITLLKNSWLSWHHHQPRRQNHSSEQSDSSDLAVNLPGVLWGCCWVWGTISSCMCSLYTSKAVWRSVVLSPALSIKTKVVVFWELGCWVFINWKLNLKLPWPMSFLDLYTCSNCRLSQGFIVFCILGGGGGG